MLLVVNDFCERQSVKPQAMHVTKNENGFFLFAYKHLL